MNLRSMGIAAILVLAGGAIGHASTSTSDSPNLGVLRSTSELPGMTGAATPAANSIFVASKDDHRPGDNHRERGDKSRDDKGKDNHKGGKGRGGHDDGPNHT